MLATLLTFLSVGLFSLVLFSVLNRKDIQRVLNARNKLRQHAELLESRPIQVFLKECAVMKGEEQGARMLLASLAEMLRVAPEKIAVERPLRDLFTVHHIDDPLKEGVTEQIEPFSYELIEKVSSMSNKIRWEQKWKEQPDLPRNEDDLADFIINMTTGEFIRFFAPLMETEKKP